MGNNFALFGLLVIEIWDTRVRDSGVFAVRFDSVGEFPLDNATANAPITHTITVEEEAEQETFGTSDSSLPWNGEALLLCERRTYGMRRIQSPKVWIPLVVIVLLIAVPVSVLVIHSAHSSPDPLCSKPENADGIIDSIDRVSGYGVVKLYDPTQKTFPPGMGRVSLLIMVDTSTRIFRQQGTACQVLQRVSFRDLRVGQKLKVWSRSGIVITTYPGQLTDPSDIVIVP